MNARCTPSCLSRCTSLFISGPGPSTMESREPRTGQRKRITALSPPRLSRSHGCSEAGWLSRVVNTCNEGVRPLNLHLSHSLVQAACRRDMTLGQGTVFSFGHSPVRVSAESYWLPLLPVPEGWGPGA